MDKTPAPDSEAAEGCLSDVGQLVSMGTAMAPWRSAHAQLRHVPRVLVLASAVTFYAGPGLAGEGGRRGPGAGGRPGAAAYQVAGVPRDPELQAPPAAPLMRATAQGQAASANACWRRSRFRARHEPSFVHFLFYVSLRSLLALTPHGVQLFREVERIG